SRKPEFKPFKVVVNRYEIAVYIRVIIESDLRPLLSHPESVCAGNIQTLFRVPPEIIAKKYRQYLLLHKFLFPGQQIGSKVFSSKVIVNPILCDSALQNPVFA